MPGGKATTPVHSEWEIRTSSREEKAKTSRPHRWRDDSETRAERTRSEPHHSKWRDTFAAGGERPEPYHSVWCDPFAARGERPEPHHPAWCDPFAAEWARPEPHHTVRCDPYVADGKRREPQRRENCCVINHYCIVHYCHDDPPFPSRTLLLHSGRGLRVLRTSLRMGACLVS